MNSLIWRGVDSTTIKGLLICELPPITKPGMRVKETTIDGRDGSIIEELGYEPYDKNVVIGLHGNFNIDEVIKYFTGEGDVVFSNEPDKVYKGKIIGQVDYTRLLRYRQATIPFRVQPYKYLLNENTYVSYPKDASGTNLVLTDSGKTPMKITTYGDAIVHGKNLFNPNSISLDHNESVEVLDGGYKVRVYGGSKSKYSSSHCTLPIAMRGKTYCLKCDNIESSKGTEIRVQVVCNTLSGSNAYGFGLTNTSISVPIPVDAKTIELYLTTNNTDAVLPEDNVLTVYGLMLTPVELKDEPWSAYEAIQEIATSGTHEVMGYSPVTVISNPYLDPMEVQYRRPFYLTNKGTEVSKPLLRIIGNGTVAVSVNGEKCFEYTFQGGTKIVYIDSEKEDAYNGLVLLNRQMNGEFPVLNPGQNLIEWSGSVDSMYAEVRSRWL